MKTYATILFLIILLITKPLHSQTPEIEKLIKTVEKTNGKEKIIALADLSKCYYSVDPIKGIELANQALKLAETLKIPSAYSKIYNSFAANYFSLNKKDSSFIWFKRALNTALQYKDSIEIGIAYNGMGLYYEKKGDFDSSLIVFHNALTIFKQIHNEERIGRALDNLATIHIHRGEFKTSLTYLIEAKNCYEKAGLTKNLPSLYVKIGRIYSETSEFATAEKWYQKGKQLSLERNDFQTAGIAINAIGIMYKNQGKNKEALKTYDEVLPIADKINNKSLLLAVYGNIGNVNQSLGNYKEAIVFHQKALDIAIALNGNVEAAIQMESLGTAYNSLKEYQKATVNLEKALHVFTTAKSLSYLLSTYEALIVANNGLKRFERSVKYYETYLQLKDSLNKNELNTALDSLKVRFKTEETDKENIALTQTTKTQNKTIVLQQVTMISALLIFILLIGFVINVVRNRKKMRQANDLLEIKNHEILTKAEDIRISNEKLLELSDFKDAMNSFLVHDLKNPLNAIINIEALQYTDDHIEVIKNSGKQMLNLVMNLLDLSKYENNKMKLSIIDTSINQIIKNAYNDVRFLIDQKNIQFKCKIKSEFIVKADVDLIERVFINLFSNAIKFSPIGGSIQVFAEVLNNNYLKIIVKDNGEGIAAEFLPVIFDKFSQIQSKQSGSTLSTGVGLSFCKMIIEAHTGEIGVTSVVGQETTFWFTLPLTELKNKINIETETFNINTNGAKKINFAAEEMNILIPICNSLKELSIFQLSDIKDILNKIETNTTKNITEWKCMLLKALSDCNEIRFNELINIISNGKL